MEYIRVSFGPADVRGVMANGSVIGETEPAVPSNYCVVSLSSPGDPPASWAGVVGDTWPRGPLPIRFGKI